MGHDPIMEMAKAIDEMLKVADHKRGCAVLSGTAEKTCTCGFESAKRALEEKKQSIVDHHLAHLG